MADYNKQIVPEVILNHNIVAEHYNIPTINLAREVTDRINNKEFTWKDDFKNLHPSPFGQGVYANSIICFLEGSFKDKVDSKDKIQANNLPDKIDLNSYDNGCLINIDMAQLSLDWSVYADWNPNDGTGTRPNFTDVPMLIGKKPGTSIKLNFEGSVVGIAVAAGKDAGIIEYRIDKSTWKKLNLFTRWSRALHLPWYYTLAAGLSKNPHTLELRITEAKDKRSTGNACRIRYFYINRN